MFSLIIEMVLRGGTILMVAGWLGVGQKLILRMFPRSSVGAWADSWGCVATLSGGGTAFPHL